MWMSLTATASGVTTAGFGLLFCGSSIAAITLTTVGMHSLAVLPGLLYAPAGIFCIMTAPPDITDGKGKGRKRKRVRGARELDVKGPGDEAEAEAAGTGGKGKSGVTRRKRPSKE